MLFIQQTSGNTCGTKFCPLLDWYESGCAHQGTQIQVWPKGTTALRILCMDTTWKVTTAFLSLTTLCSVGCSEVTIIATTHSKKKTKVNTYQKRNCYFEMPLYVGFWFRPTAEYLNLISWVNSEGEIQILRKHNPFSLAGERVDKILSKKRANIVLWY